MQIICCQTIQPWNKDTVSLLSFINLGEKYFKNTLYNKLDVCIKHTLKHCNDGGPQQCLKTRMLF